MDTVRVAPAARADDPASATEVVRVRDANDRVVGAGFLVAERHVMTCAHVVNAACGLAADARDDLGGTELLLDFPLVAPFARLPAKVVAWFPVAAPNEPSGTTDIEDVAVLELGTAPPPGSEIAVLARGAATGHGGVEAIGFPPQLDDGQRFEGKISGPLARGQIQIVGTTTTGGRIAEGYSGGPVWDRNRRAVVGMVVQANTDPQAKIATMIPVETLIRAWPHLAAPAPPPSPYRGLAAFRPEDRELFFGRDATIARVERAIAVRSLVAVVGPSGSGKSSLVLAGLVPRLADRGCRWTVARPRLDDVVAKLTALRGAATHAGRFGDGSATLPRLVADLGTRGAEAPGLLLVIDQFEEVFAPGTPEDERDRFFEALVAAFGADPFEDGPPPAVAVLTVRADFLHLLYGAGGRLPMALADADVKVLPMGRDDLRAAIEQPACARNVAIEATVTEKMLDAVGRGAGTLPLLEFTLDRLWLHQEDRRLTDRSYEMIRGVEGALALYADEVRERLHRLKQDRDVRRVLVQLVQPGGGNIPATRRQATRAQLGDAWPTAIRLADAKLVVTDGDTLAATAELIHEALIEGWPQLAEWVKEDADFRTWQEELRGDLGRWESAKRDGGALLRGGPLETAESWLAERPFELSETEREYVRASRCARDTAAERDRARLDRGHALGGAVGSGFGFGASLALVFWLTSKQDQDLLVASVPAAAMFPPGALVGLAIGLGIGLRAVRDHDGRRAAVAGVAGAIAGAMAFALYHVWTDAGSWESVAVGALAGGGLGVGESVPWGRWWRLGITVALATAGLLAGAAIAGSLVDDPGAWLLAGPLLGGLTGVGFMAVARSDRQSADVASSGREPSRGHDAADAVA